jgi:hemerythrin
MLIDWNDTLVLGDDRIDLEHRDMAATINRFLEVLESGASRDEICDVAFTLGEQVTQHFNNEVELMEATDYPGAAAHQREHKMLMGELGTFLRRVGQEDDRELLKVAGFIESWFVTHVATADAKFVKFLTEETQHEAPLPASW